MAINNDSDTDTFSKHIYEPRCQIKPHVSVVHCTAEAAQSQLVAQALKISFCRKRQLHAVFSAQVQLSRGLLGTSAQFARTYIQQHISSHAV